MHSIHQFNRRCFLGSAAAALATARYATAAQNARQNPAPDKSVPAAEGHPLVVPGYYGNRPGIQLATQLPPTASEDDMRFARQLGVEWVMTDLPPAESTLENYTARGQD